MFKVTPFMTFYGTVPEKQVFALNAIILVLSEGGALTYYRGTGLGVESIQTILPELTGITVSGTTNVREGETTTIVITAIPADASTSGATFESSDETVVTVNSAGKVTGVSIGSATITVTVGDFTATTEVVVAPPALTGFTVTLDPSEGRVGDKLQATADTPVPTDAVLSAITWATSDKSIATVNALGKVTCIAEGDVTITATDTDTGVTSDITFTVLPAIPVITSEPETPVTVNFGESTELTVTATGADTYLWKAGTDPEATWDVIDDPSATTDTCTFTPPTGEVWYAHCVVSNAGGDAYTTDVVINVNGVITTGSVSLDPDTLSTDAAVGTIVTATLVSDATEGHIHYEWLLTGDATGGLGITWDNTTDGSKATIEVLKGFDQNAGGPVGVTCTANGVVMVEATLTIVYVNPDA